MTPTLERKLATLVTRFEEHLAGGFTDGWGHKRSVLDQVEVALRDPEVMEWLDAIRRNDSTVPIRRL